MDEETKKYETLAKEKEEAERVAEEIVRQLECDADQHIDALQRTHIEVQRLSKEEERRMKAYLERLPVD